MSRPIAYRGSLLSIEYAVRTSGKSPGLIFYEELDDRDKAKLNTLFERLGEFGKISNVEKFKKLEGSLFEFKSHQIRMLCTLSQGGL